MTRGGNGMRAFTFRDEFDGPAGAPPDPSRWSCDTGGGGWGNGELQVYTDSVANAFQDGRSHLVIRATRPMTSDGTRPDRAYHSARITTRDRFCQSGGIFEARIKVDSRRGLWPAFWLMGRSQLTAGWPACGEVDVVEDFGYSATSSSVHAPAAGNALHSARQDMPSDARWHVYRLRWTDDAMSFSRDGHTFLNVGRDFCPPPAWVFGPAEAGNGGMFMLLNLAVGGNAGEPPPGTAFPADLMVDYIRVSGPELTPR